MAPVMKKRTLLILAILFMAFAVIFAIKAFQSQRLPDDIPSEAVSEPAAPTETERPPRSAENRAQEPAAEQEQQEPYISPIDFASLQEENPDIYAWLTIEDTNIDYPLVQHPGNDAYYLNHDSDRTYAVAGAIFSEATYTSIDLTDPVTVVYGHRMSSGSMFGRLQQYFSDTAFFESHPTFTVYTPTEELTYGIFAAVPYSGDHILYYNDFTDEAVFQTFFASLMNIRDLSARFNREYAPAAGDRVMILSTCLAGNNTRRYLVMGTLLTNENQSQGG